MPREKRTTGMEAIATRISAYAVHVSRIEIQAGFLQRDEINREQVESLKQQILNGGPRGVHTPITGFYQNMKFMLNHGHHRVTAVKELYEDGTLTNLMAEGKITEDDLNRIVNIPATRVAPPIGRNEEETKRAKALLYLKQIVDNSGKEYKPLEKARVCHLVSTEYDLDRAFMAEFLGVSPAQISNWLSLMELPEEIQDNVAEGSIAATYVNELVREHGEEKAVELIQKAVEKAKKEGKPKVTKKDIEADSDKLTKKQAKELAKQIQLYQMNLDDGKSMVDTESLAKLLSFFE